MCLGVARRGNLDEEDWFDKREEFFESYKDLDEELEAIEEDGDDGAYPSLLYWLGNQLMTTRCSNEGAVLKWTLVPFIVEEHSDEEANDSSPEDDIDVKSDDEEL